MVRREWYLSALLWCLTVDSRSVLRRRSRVWIIHWSLIFYCHHCLLLLIPAVFLLHAHKYPHRSNTGMPGTMYGLMVFSPAANGTEQFLGFQWGAMRETPAKEPLFSSTIYLFQGLGRESKECSRFRWLIGVSWGWGWFQLIWKFFWDSSEILLE